MLTPESQQVCNFVSRNCLKILHLRDFIQHTSYFQQCPTKQASTGDSQKIKKQKIEKFIEITLFTNGIHYKRCMTNM